MRTPSSLVSHLVPVTALALAACNLLAEDTESAEEALSCAKFDDPHCGHPIDRLVVPKLRAAGLSPRDGEPFGICRRLAIDLVGRIPTTTELERCVAAADMGARADLFLALPAYPTTQARGWAETLGFNTEVMWYGYGVEMDAMAARLYARAGLDWATFARDIAVYPGFYGLHQGDDWAASVIRIFLGRTARPDEIAGMRPLVRMFDQATICDGAVYTAAYDEAIAGGEDAESAAYDASEACIGGDHEEYAINVCNCVRGGGSVGCRSNALGTLIDIGTDGCANPNDERPRANFYRLDDGMAPGKRTHCKTANGEKPCRDRIITEKETVGAPIGPAKLADPGLRARLGKVGEALAARADFWEAGADRELGRLIGWWKDGVRRPDYDLPEVRTLLAGELKRTGSLREVQRLIVTSLLYVAPPEPPSMSDGREPPLWSMAGSKILTAESWLDAAGFATFGRPLGLCDYRFVGTGQVGPTYNVDQSLVRRLDGPLPSFAGNEYAARVQMLGGCSADQPRPRSSSVGVTYAEHDFARSLCAAGTAIVPSGIGSDTTNEALGKIARHVVRQTLSRPATDEEATELASEMKRCLAAGGSRGCGSSEAAARWLCTRLIDSAEFALY